MLTLIATITMFAFANIVRMGAAAQSVASAGAGVVVAALVIAWISQASVTQSDALSASRHV